MNAIDPPRYAVIGNPVAHSRSPRIHALFTAQTGVRLAYERVLAPVDGFTETVKAFFAAGGRGLNVTVPFKEDAWRLADCLSARAQTAGAVNTLWCADGRLHGCNTDGVGLVGDLQRLGADLQGLGAGLGAGLSADTRLAGARILLVGAGGAARGVLQPLLEAGCAQIRVVNRTAARAVALVRDWQDAAVAVEAGSLSDAVRPGGWDVVINATASSLSGVAPALPTGLYAKNALAYDMMYGGGHGQSATPFMQQALADGAAHAADGLGMLVGQAAESFYLWHGVRPEVAPVLAAVRAELDANPLDANPLDASPPDANP